MARLSIGIGVGIAGACICTPAVAQGYAFVLDVYRDAQSPKPTVVTSPDVGARRVVTAGEQVIDQRNGRLVDGAIITAPYSSGTKIFNAFSASAGAKFYRVASKAVLKACWVSLGAQGDTPCFLDDNGDGQFDRVASNSGTKAFPLQAPVPYEKAMVLIPAAESGFTRSVLYQGASGDGLRLSYREFRNDLARPAFEESLTIPLTREFPQKVAVKGAVMTIFKIDGLGMDYQIDSKGSFEQPIP